MHPSGISVTGLALRAFLQDGHGGQHFAFEVFKESKVLPAVAILEERAKG